MLVQYLREQLGKTGTVIGCDTGELRRLHRPSRRPQREIVQRPGRTGRRRSEVTTIEGIATDGELHPVQEAFHECHAPAVRVLHARHDHAGRGPARREPPPDRGPDPARAWRATSAGAPATRTSCARCGTRPATTATDGGAADDHDGRSPRHRRGRPRRRDRPRPAPQGGPAPHHGTHPLDRQHRGSPARCTWPWCAARTRTRTSQGIDTRAAAQSPNVVAVLTGADLADAQGVLANAWPITTDQVTPVHKPVAVDRVAFAGEIVAVVVARSVAAAPDAAELVDVDYRSCPPPSTSGPPPRQHPRTAAPSRTPTWAPTTPPAGSSTPARPAPAATSRTPSPPPAPTASSLSASTASSGSSRHSWSRAPSSSTPPASRSPCGPPPRSRTSPASSWPPPRACPSRRSGSSRPTSAADSAASCRPHPRSGRRSPSRAASASPSSTPRPAPSHCSPPTTAATSGRSSPSPPAADGTVTGLKVELLVDLGAYVGVVAAACPCSAHSCTTASTSSPPTGSTAAPS